MRVSTLGAYRQGLNSMQELQALTSRTQRQIASGQRILTPSDDPISSSRVLELGSALSRIEQFDRNGTIAKNRLQDEETALQSINNVLQRVRELALTANNATQSNESRAVIAVEMRQHLEQLEQFANQKDGNGRFLFSGNLDETVPIVSSGGVFSYNGDQGHRQIQIGESRSVSDGDSGADVFFMIREGNGHFSTSPANSNTGSGVIGKSSLVDPSLYDSAEYTVRFLDSSSYEILDASNASIGSGTYLAGESIEFQGIQFSLDGEPVVGDEFVVSPSRNQDVFTSIQQLITAVDSGVGGESSRAAMNNGINRGLENIDQAIGNMLDVRTRVGSRLIAIDSQRDANSGFTLTLQQTINELQDLDYAEAISRLSFELSVLEAAQQSFARTQSLSLFNYL